MFGRWRRDVVVEEDEDEEARTLEGGKDWPGCYSISISRWATTAIAAL